MTCSILPQGDSCFNGLSRQWDRLMGKQFGGTDFFWVVPFPPKSSEGGSPSVS